MSKCVFVDPGVENEEKGATECDTAVKSRLEAEICYSSSRITLKYVVKGDRAQ